MKLEKIYFSQKGSCALQNRNMLDVLNYCLSESDSFIVHRNKLLIRKYSRKIEKIYKINLKTVN
jgi:hypothetical protein